MIDREKVIKGLTAIEDEAYDRWVHRQYIEDPLITLIRDNIPDALALLREEEPIKPKPTGIEPHYNCGACKMPIIKGCLFCSWCGRQAKWVD